MKVYAITIHWSGFSRTLPYRFAGENDKKTCQHIVDTLNELIPTFKHELIEVSETPEVKHGKHKTK